ncbi:MAG: LamG-like jellyroll fold domain-containing protein [Verrucomicrobiota bacterium]
MKPLSSFRSLLLPLALACLPPATGLLRAEPARPPQVLFSLDFDSGFTARAQGASAPVHADRAPDLVPGKRGQAAVFGPGQVLGYATKGNLNKERGSLSVWLQAPVDGFGADAGGQRRTLFRENGPYAGRDTNTIWVWHHPGRGLRADVRDPRDRYIYVNNSGTWKQGDWHHFVFTWDHTKGTQAYVDGEWVAQSVATKWQPKFHQEFLIGAADETGLHPWGAAIDELKIFDRELTEAEVRAEFLKDGAFITRTRLFEHYLTADREGFVRLEFYNPADTAAELTDLRYVLLGANDRELAKGRLADQSLAGRDRVLVQVPLTVAIPGEFRLRLDYTDGAAARSEEFPVRVQAAGSDAASLPVVEKLITEIDASVAKPIAQSAPSTVVRSPLGHYREAGKSRHDRFALEFHVKSAGSPHVAVITYPDDKARTMEMMLHDLSGKKDFQAQIGVFTGDEYPVSGGMLEQRVLFWPHSTRQSFIFMTAEQDKPAAVARIRIYELDGIPSAPAPRAFNGSVPAREIGIYYEDPVLNQSFGESTDFSGFAEAMTKTLDYMDLFGQGTLHYPVAWYDGPLYGSIAEPLQQPFGVGGIRPHPPGYPAYFVQRLDARGKTFNAGLHMHLLPSLIPAAITDLARIHAGEETVLNMRRDGKLWHGHYHGSDPGYNPLDPRVQQAVADVVDEVVRRYGDQPGFTGVSLVLARVKIFAFGSAESGYNDINLRRFQRDTGITIPGYKPGDPRRFVASGDWLRANPAAWEKWIDWRCAGLHAHYRRIADAITARHPNLKLTLNLFTPRSDYERMADYLNHDPLDAWREMGIDPRLYADDDNISLSYTLVPGDYRWRRGLGDDSADLESNRTVFLAPESMAFMNAVAHTEATIHDRYWEDAIGRTAPMRDLPVAEHTWRVSTLNAGGRNSMEPYVAALNNFDAQRITKGGFLIGTFGMERDIEEFSRAYRTLPAVRFDDIPSLADPVRVRQKTVDGRLYFYVLNRLSEAAAVNLDLSAADGVENLADGTTQPVADGRLRVVLQPFELRAFAAARGASAATITGGRTEVSAAWRENLHRDMQTAISRVAAIQKTHPEEFARFAPYVRFARECWKQGDYARLHFLLQEYWAVGSRKLAAEKR